jgi:low temperature requirement protein LtrA
MLQKGFLKFRHNEGKTGNTKISQILFIAGIIIILGNFLGMLAQMSKGGEISTLCLVLFLVGFFMVTVSLWAKFFKQRQSHRIS